MTIPFIVVGCPVSKREWIMDHWFNFTKQALDRVECRFRYVFVGDASGDETFEVIQRRAGDLATVVETHEYRALDERSWTTERKNQMVVYRNVMLDAVRAMEPDYFLSLDSDILLHPDAISSMIDTLHRKRWDTFAEAVGGKCYMTPLPEGPLVNNPRVGTACPSFLLKGRAGMFRRRDPEIPSVIEVDILMAIKLMTPAAYAIDYQPHQWGEDIGWSLACHDAGLRFLWDGQVTNKHVMRPQDLHVLDPRCGF